MNLINDDGKIIQEIQIFDMTYFLSSWKFTGQQSEASLNCFRVSGAEAGTCTRYGCPRKDFISGKLSESKSTSSAKRFFKNSSGS